MKWFKRLSLRNRLLVSFLVVAMMPLLIFQTVFFRFLQNRTLSQELETVRTETMRLAEYYRSLFDRVTLSAQNLENFRPLETYLETEYDTRYDVYSAYFSDIHPMLEIGASVELDVDVCVHHGKTDVPVFSSELHPDLDAFLEKYPDMKNDGSWYVGTRWSYEPTSISLRYLLPVRSEEQYPELDWVIEFKLSEEVLSRHLRKDTGNGLAFLVTGDGDVLAASDKRYRDDSLTGGLKSVMPLLQKEQPPNVRLDGTDYLVFAQPVQEFWVLYLMAADDIHQQYTQATGIYLMICLFVLLLMIVAIRWTASSLTAGVRRLSEKMQNLDSARIRQLTEEATDRDSHNEVDQLDAVFTDLMITIDQQEIALRDQIIARQEVEISRIDAESRALQHQINPHYLFNTLEAIRMKLVLKNEEETADIIQLFAESFRRYMEDHDTFVPLKEELTFVEKFVRIQNYRFENNIQYLCHADPALMEEPVLKLMIQPLVENAILHGIARKKTGGTVRLEIKRENELLCIRVTDDGIGMNRTELLALQQRIRIGGEYPSSIGLPNIARRLQLVYGKESTLQIRSNPQQGTCIEVLIPRKESR